MIMFGKLRKKLKLWLGKDEIKEEKSEKETKPEKVETPLQETKKEKEEEVKTDDWSEFYKSLKEFKL